jgi:hypothetical protein
MKPLKIILSLTLMMCGKTYAEQPATHGMLLFGNKATYASHLPMFHAPHDYQVIQKLNLTDPTGQKTLAKYEALKNGGETFFTLVPEVMDLTLLISGKKTTYTASLYQGHFEREGKNLGTINVQVVKTVFSAKLSAKHTPEKPENSNNYLIFGENGEYFAAHLIQERPSFDMILEVNQPYSINLHNCTRTSCQEPKPVPLLDSRLPVTLPYWLDSNPLAVPGAGTALGNPLHGIADIQAIIYFEQNELAH